MSFAAKYKPTPPPKARGWNSEIMNDTSTWNWTDTPEPTVSGDGWYKGSIAYWYIFPPTSTYLSVEIKTPNGLCGSGEFYYVLLSCFDDAGSYNQIGFSADHGHWGLTWCWTEHDESGWIDTYHYDPSAIILDQDTNYHFEMSLDNGYLTYRLRVGGWIEWSKTVYTKGDYFILNRYAQVGWHTYMCFTNYEEVYDTDGQTPDFNFKFQNTQTANGYWDNWIELSQGAPAGVDVTISTTQHYVYVSNPDA
ncbi:MAG: hypothetical protein GF309_05375 [Candidatus Lokiarchaeota archaeon]|nr:hypothetical protein [Candidatus Lokiarchaeota archaeon]